MGCECQIVVALDRPSYTAERRHSGEHWDGKTPLQTFIENATLAYDKEMDRIRPTSDRVAAAA